MATRAMVTFYIRIWANLGHEPLAVEATCSARAIKVRTLKYTPGVHVNYAETVLPMKDGLPKFKDFPGEFGGSGEQIAE